MAEIRIKENESLDSALRRSFRDQKERALREAQRKEKEKVRSRKKAQVLMSDLFLQYIKSLNLFG